jgi:hypothetical protein
VNDDFADRVPLPSGAATVAVNNIGATAETGEPFTGGSHSVWFSWVAPSTGEVGVFTVEADFGAILAVFTGNELMGLSLVVQGQMQSPIAFQANAGVEYQIAVSGNYFPPELPSAGQCTLDISLPRLAPANDDFANREVVEPTAVSTVGNNLAATSETGEPSLGGSRTVWYSWTAPASGSVLLELEEWQAPARLAVYTGGTVNTLLQVVAGSQFLPKSPAIFDAVSGTTYSIAVADRVGPGGGGAGEFTLSINGPHGPPPNDDFDNRTVLTPGPTTVSGMTLGATSEATEPALFRRTSVWYEWTAPMSGEVAVQLPDVDFASYLGVFIGSGLEGLVQVVAVGPDQPALFQASGGVAYQIVVSGRDDPFSVTDGDFTLSILGPALAPANDHFANRLGLVAGAPPVTGTNLGASIEGQEPFVGGDRSVWYSFTATASGGTTVLVSDPTFSPVIGIFTGTSLGLLTQVASVSVEGGAIFEATAGIDYHIAVTSTSAPFGGGAGDFAIAITDPALSPSNDSFDAALPLASGAVSVIGTNAGASKQQSEPNHGFHFGGRSVWYEWTAPGNGEVTIHLKDLSFRPLLGVYVGGALSNLSVLSSSSFGTPLSFQAIGGTLYRIAVDGYKGESGSFTLEISDPTPLVANDNFISRISLPSGATSISGDTTLASKELGEPNHGANPGGRSVWYSWTAPSGGLVTVRLINTSFQPLLGIYSGTEVGGLNEIAGSSSGGELDFRAVGGTTYAIAVDGFNGQSGPFTLTMTDPLPTPLNDDFANRTVLSSGPLSVGGTNVNASKEPGEPNHAGIPGGRSVWYSWTAPSSGTARLHIARQAFFARVGIYVGNSVDTLVSVPFYSFGPDIPFQVAAGTTYHIAVDGLYASSGRFELELGAVVEPPPNDSFSNREVLSGLPAFADGNNIAATMDLDEPSHDSRTGGRSVWWTWTAPVTGPVTFGVAHNSVALSNGILAIYTGSSLASLVPVASRTSGAPLTLSLSVTSGTVYQIAVDGLNAREFGLGSTGEFSLSVSQPPPNDLFANAIDLGTVSTAASGSWIDSSVSSEAGEPRPNYLPSNHVRSIWWRWTAPVTAWVSFDTLGSSLDSALTVYTGSTVSELTETTRNLDANVRGNSSAAFEAVAGETYHVRVHGEVFDKVGTVNVNLVTLTPPTTVDDHIRLGRAYLQLQSDVGIASADSEFAAALAINPNHAEANFLKALTRCALLEQGVAFQNALVGLGLIDSDIYQWAYVPRDSQDDPIAMPNTSTTPGIDYLENTLLPELPVIRAHLDKASAPDFSISLSDSETSSAFRLIDAADVSVLKAGTYAMEAAIRLLQTVDAGVSMTDVIDDFNSGQFNAENLIESFGNFLGSTGGNERAAFKAALQQSVTCYEEASNFARTVRSSNPRLHVFQLEQVDYEAEQDALNIAQSVSTSFDGPTVVGGEIVDLSKFVSSSASVRQQLPKTEENLIVASTAPDPTFDGVLPNSSQQKVNHFFRRHGFLYEVSSFGNWATVFLDDLSAADQMKSANPDFDLLSNFGEYVFNLDPTASDSPDAYQATQLATDSVDGKEYFHIAYVRRIERNGLQYVVAVSDDLITWDRTQTQVQQVGSPHPTGDGETEIVTFRLLASPEVAAKKFVRIEVSDGSSPGP